LSAGDAQRVVRSEGPPSGVAIAAESPTLPGLPVTPTLPQSPPDIDAMLVLPRADEFLSALDRVLVRKPKTRMQGSEVWFEPGLDVALQHSTSHLNPDLGVNALAVSFRTGGADTAVTWHAALETRLWGGNGVGYWFGMTTLSDPMGVGPGTHFGFSAGYGRQMLSTGAYDSVLWTGMVMVYGLTERLSAEFEFRPNWLRLLGNEPPKAAHASPLFAGLSYDLGPVFVRAQLERWWGIDKWIVPGFAIGGRL
jgi:hypothetical protein